MTKNMMKKAMEKIASQNRDRTKEAQKRQSSPSTKSKRKSRRDLPYKKYF